MDGFGMVRGTAAGHDVAAMADEGSANSRGGKLGWVVGELKEPNVLFLGLGLGQF